MSGSKVSGIMSSIVSGKNSFKASLGTANVSINNWHLYITEISLEHLLSRLLFCSVFVWMLELCLIHCVELSESIIRNNIIRVPFVDSGQSS
jgi:hypothetical protein